MKPYLIILYFLICVLAGSLADGFNMEKRKTLGHILEPVELFLLMTFPFLFGLSGVHDWIAYIAGYTCFRIALFDYGVNLAAGLPLSYSGTSNIWDRFLRKFPPVMHIFPRVLFLVAGVSVTFRYLT